jgi:hypothetical protein
MSRGARAPALIISYEEAQHSSLLRTCAMPRWLWPAYTPRKKPALARGLSPSTGDCGATCQLRRPTPSQLRSYRAAHARRRSLSLGRRRSTRACCVRAQYRADCGRPMPSRGTLRWQEAILHQRLPVMRRASCGLQRQASSACHAAHARAVARCLWRGGAALKTAVRARRATLVAIAADATTKEQRRREASLPPRAPVVQRASTASNAKPAPLVTRRTRAISRYIFGEAQHSSLLRSRAVPRWLW